MIRVPPIWLPGMLKVNGNWETVLNRLYRVFEHDFCRETCEFQGRTVRWNRSRDPGDAYDRGFWHLITELDQARNERLFDPRRAERLPWCKPVIANSFRPEVLAWDYVEATHRTRSYLWLKRWDYIVVLEKGTSRAGIDFAFLVTAYHVGGSQTRRTLQRKYESRVQ